MTFPALSRRKERRMPPVDASLRPGPGPVRFASSFPGSRVRMPPVGRPGEGPGWVPGSGRMAMAETRLGAARLAMIAGLAALTLGPALGGAGRLTYHEAFVAQAAREMAAGGDVLVPTIG